MPKARRMNAIVIKVAMVTPLTGLLDDPSMPAMCAATVQNRKLMMMTASTTNRLIQSAGRYDENNHVKIAAQPTTPHRSQEKGRSLSLSRGCSKLELN